MLCVVGEGMIKHLWSDLKYQLHYISIMFTYEHYIHMESSFHLG